MTAENWSEPEFRVGIQPIENLSAGYGRYGPAPQKTRGLPDGDLPDLKRLAIVPVVAEVPPSAPPGLPLAAWKTGILGRSTLLECVAVEKGSLT
jgi:hypothetical protein